MLILHSYTVNRSMELEVAVTLNLWCDLSFQLLRPLSVSSSPLSAIISKLIHLAWIETTRFNHAQKNNSIKAAGEIRANERVKKGPFLRSEYKSDLNVVVRTEVTLRFTSIPFTGHPS